MLITGTKGVSFGSTSDDVSVRVLGLHVEMEGMGPLKTRAVNAEETFFLVHVYGTYSGFVALCGWENIVPNISDLVVSAMFPIHWVVFRVITTAGIHDRCHIADAVMYVGFEGRSDGPVYGERNGVTAVIIITY